MTAILGISAFYHDSAAALVRDGTVVAAAQEERFSREKHDSELPVRAIRSCLEAAGLEPGDLDYVGFYDKPYLKFGRLLETYLSYAPSGFRSFRRAMPVWLGQKLHLTRELDRGLARAYRRRYVFTEHHESHAASAFFPSPFEEAAILTMDGVGEWATATFGVGRGNRIRITDELRFPHSLGLLYSAFTYFAGFKVNSDEYKLMGLAPYGEPRYVDRILEHLVDLKDDGSFRMDMSYFNYCQGLTMTSRKFERLFGGPPRVPESEITPREMDLAASIQKVTEEIVLRAARHVHARTGAHNLCLAGGVALNCVANGRILRESPFDGLWIQPASGDAGGALGTALFIWHQLLDGPRRPGPSDSQRGSLLGPAFDDPAIGAFLDGVGAVYERLDDDDAVCERAAEAMAGGQVVGWFQGPMEFGPRALGSRSLLGDARDPRMQSVMNMKVKFRESFRPFAPAVLREHAAEYFGLDGAHDSPYMLLVAPVLEPHRLGGDGAGAAGLDKLRVVRSTIPAVTHVDYSARVQTVDRERHGLYRRLLESFHRRTGCPVVVNTSFNLGWEPIVCTPKDAYDTFMSSDVDVLCMGRHVLDKRSQPGWVPEVGDGGTRRVRLDGRWTGPCCGGALEEEGRGLVCLGCGRRFPVEHGIPLLFWPHDPSDGVDDVTEKVKAFYEETPFPNYDEHDSLRSLVEKSRRGRYARALDRSLPYNAAVLEVGCGTGQLSNFLGIACRRVVATDICVNSLRLGEEFRRKHGSPRVSFVQMNLFRPCFGPGSFDVVLCNGVLHHTGDPFAGFRSILGLLRPGGHIVVGLYNRYGRLMTDVRRMLFRLTGGRGRWLDPYLREGGIGADKRRAWFEDQYRHPHESKHTVDEVFGWFRETGVEFVRAIPAIAPGVDPLAGDLFEPQPRGNALHHLAAQLAQVVTGSREGGLFLMIGRKVRRQEDAA